MIFKCVDIIAKNCLQAKHVWRLVAGLILLSFAAVSADGEVSKESEHDHEVLIRNERGAKNRG